MLVYITIWIAMSPQQIPNPPDPQLGNFDNAAFLGPLMGGIGNFVLLTMFTFIFGPVSGAHFNPTITIATFCARLCSLPRNGSIRRIPDHRWHLGGLVGSSQLWLKTI